MPPALIALLVLCLALTQAAAGGTVEVCVRRASGLPKMDGSFLHDPRPDPFVVITMDGVSDPVAECRKVGLVKGEPMRQTERDGSGCCRSNKVFNTFEPSWPTFCCAFPEDTMLSVSVWEDDVLSDCLLYTSPSPRD